MAIIIVAIVALLTAQTTAPETPTATNIENIVYTGSSITLYATAEGTTPITYNWYKDNIWIGITDSFVLQNIQPSNSGTYKVIANNIAGFSESEPYKLTVITPTPPEKVKIIKR